MNITFILAILCGLIFFTLLAVMIISIVLTCKWSVLAVREERKRRREESDRDEGTDI